MSSEGSDVCYAFAGLFAGLGAYLYGLGQYRLKKFIEYTPTSKAVSVAPGIAEVAGVARTAGKTYVSPFEQKGCLFYQTKIYKWSGSGKHRRKTLVDTLFTDDPICIEDSTGRVLVQPELEGGKTGALDALFYSLGGRKFMTRDMVDQDRNYSSTPKKGFFSKLFTGQERDEKLTGFLKVHSPSLADYGDTVEVEERYICDGDQLYVIGTAAEFDVGGRPQMKVCYEKKDGLFCMADGTEKRALSAVAFWAYASMLGGPILFVLCFDYLMVRFQLFGALAVLINIAILFLMYSYIALVHALEFYNGMIVLKNSVERARANVDALLARRSALISSLVEVVKAAARHERKMMGSLTKIRADSGPQSAHLLAISENYPKLRANENFKSLQSELSHTEDWIAGARIYVADSIALYNTRISSFPYFLIAPLAGLRPIQNEPVS